MANKISQTIAPPPAAAIPNPPGGGSWRWDGAEWQENIPASEQNVGAEIDGSMPPGAVIDPHLAATPAAD
jgi:hypothetical protein